MPLHKNEHAVYTSKILILRIYQQNPSQCLTRHIQSHADLSYCVTPSLKHYKVVQEYLACLSIAYSNWPRLRYRLTLSG